MVNDAEMRHLRRCVELAAEALEAGDEPFGSVLVAANGAVLAEDRNRVASGDPTRHPEFALARWAAANMTPEERAAATVFTSGEHCPMCAAAHGWVGLGRIVYVSFFRAAGGLARRAGHSPITRANPADPGGRTRRRGGGPGSRPRGAGTRPAPPLSQPILKPSLKLEISLYYKQLVI